MVANRSKRTKSKSKQCKHSKSLQGASKRKRKEPTSTQKALDRERQNRNKRRQRLAKRLKKYTNTKNPGDDLVAGVKGINTQWRWVFGGRFRSVASKLGSFLEDVANSNGLVLEEVLRLRDQARAQAIADSSGKNGPSTKDTSEASSGTTSNSSATSSGSSGTSQGTNSDTGSEASFEGRSSQPPSPGLASEGNTCGIDQSCQNAEELDNEACDGMAPAPTTGQKTCGDLPRSGVLEARACEQPKNLSTMMAMVIHDKAPPTTPKPLTISEMDPRTQLTRGQDAATKAPVQGNHGARSASMISGAGPLVGPVTDAEWSAMAQAASVELLTASANNDVQSVTALTQARLALLARELARRALVPGESLHPGMLGLLLSNPPHTMTPPPQMGNGAQSKEHARAVDSGAQPPSTGATQQTKQVPTEQAPITQSNKKKRCQQQDRQKDTQKLHDETTAWLKDNMPEGIYSVPQAAREGCLAYMRDYLARWRLLSSMMPQGKSLPKKLVDQRAYIMGQLAQFSANK